MTNSGVLDVSKKKSGRPVEPEPLRSLVSLKGSVEYEAWLDELVERSHLGTRTLLIKNALRVFGQQFKMKEPPKR